MLNSIVRTAFKLFNSKLEMKKGASIDIRAFPARGGSIVIGEHSVVRAGAMLLPSGGSIVVGARSSINHYAVINGEGGVKIGNNVMIAAFTSIFAANHKYDRLDIPMRDQGMITKGGIFIDDDVWIGTHVVILDGVVIGAGSVIAAGAVVTKEVKPYSIMAGVPAKEVGSRLSKK